MSNTAGIIGSGAVGVTIANGLITHGYEVMIGTSSASKREDLLTKTGGKARVGSIADAAAYSDLLVFSTKGITAESVLGSIGAQALAGKTIIDTTNPTAEVAPINGVMPFFTGPDASLLERLQRLAPEAHFVKAFNSVGTYFMVNPDFGGITPTMFICGNDEEAKKRVAGIVELFGWEVEDMGAAEAARAIEPLSMLWCIPGFRENRWAHAFKLLKK
jgi:8-hydroxy-5-deazaflavin:NADPH oxidoreductase